MWSHMARISCSGPLEPSLIPTIVLLLKHLLVTKTYIYLSSLRVRSDICTALSGLLHSGCLWLAKLLALSFVCSTLTDSPLNASDQSLRCALRAALHDICGLCGKWVWSSLSSVVLFLWFFLCVYRLEETFRVYSVLALTVYSLIYWVAIELDRVGPHEIDPRISRRSPPDSISIRLENNYRPFSLCL